jgi:hypothetical protein
MRGAGKVPIQQGELIMPTVLGATNWAPPSYSPKTGLFYISLWENTRTIAVEGGRPRGAGVPGTGGTPMAQATLTPNFEKEEEGYFLALDARNETLLWKLSLGGQINSGPMIYAVRGRQYVSVTAPMRCLRSH